MAEGRAEPPSSPSGGASDGHGDALTSMLEPGLAGESSEAQAPLLTEIIENLATERKELKFRRARVLKDLRNAKRRNTRLKSRTKLLSSNDLMEVLHQRRAKKAEAPPEPAAAATTPASNAVP